MGMESKGLFNNMSVRIDALEEKVSSLTDRVDSLETTLYSNGAETKWIGICKPVFQESLRVFVNTFLAGCRDANNGNMIIHPQTNELAHYVDIVKSALQPANVLQLRLNVITFVQNFERICGRGCLIKFVTEVDDLKESSNDDRHVIANRKLKKIVSNATNKTTYVKYCNNYEGTCECEEEKAESRCFIAVIDILEKLDSNQMVKWKK